MITANSRKVWRFSARQVEVLDRNVVGDWRALLKTEPWVVAKALGLICKLKEDLACKLLQPYGLQVIPNRPKHLKSSLERAKSVNRPVKKQRAKSVKTKTQPEVLSGLQTEQLKALAVALLERAGYKVTFK